MMPNNPFLSIVVIFCDKDYQFIESLCKEINKNVKLSHEIILIDNREVYKDKFINLPENAFMHSVGYNAYQFEGRRLAVQFCSGKYVWYVDADDEVLIVEDYWKDAISDEDVALFSAMMTDLSFKLNKSFFIRKALLNNSIYLSRDWHELELKNVWNFFGCCLWDKWIKRTVLEEVIKFTATEEFRRLGIDYIEINLSAMQCLRADLADEIISLVQKYDVDPKYINLEITETAVDYDPSITDSNINKLDEMGFTFSLDDYGTGYSNIRRVVSLPISLVKIDKSLVDEMDNPQMWTVITNTVNMLKNMNKEILVEGVEDARTVEKFTELGCDYIQGFYFSKPLPEKDFVEFIKKANA